MKSLQREDDGRVVSRLPEEDGQEEMKDFLARLEANIEANQAKTDVKLKEMSEEIKSV
jgi:hypothetical protein